MSIPVAPGSLWRSTDTAHRGHLRQIVQRRRRSVVVKTIWPRRRGHQAGPMSVALAIFLARHELVRPSRQAA